jgi:hypothetical protein
MDNKETHSLNYTHEQLQTMLKKLENSAPLSHDELTKLLKVVEVYEDTNGLDLFVRRDEILDMVESFVDGADITTKKSLDEFLRQLDEDHRIDIQNAYDEFSRKIEWEVVEAVDRYFEDVFCFDTLEDMAMCKSDPDRGLVVPEGFIAYCKETQLRYEYLSEPIEGCYGNWLQLKFGEEYLKQSLLDRFDKMEDDILINAENIEINRQDIATNAKNIETNKQNIETNAENIETNKQNIATNKQNIATNASNIETNKQNIAANASDIETNRQNIGVNAENIAINKTNIATNAENIETNSNNIEVNKQNIAANTSNIEINKNDIAANKANIDTNKNNIEINTENIAANTEKILINTESISENTENIAINTENISDNAINILTNATNIETNAVNIQTNSIDISTNAKNIQANRQSINEIIEYIAANPGMGGPELPSLPDEGGNSEIPDNIAEILDVLNKTDEELSGRVDAVESTLEDLKDVINNEGIPGRSGNCAYFGDEEPEDDEQIWFSDNTSSVANEVTYDNPVISELFACIRTLQSQVKKLQEDVEYIKLNGGGNVDRPEEPDVTEESFLGLENGDLFLLEDGGYINLEEVIIASQEARLALENGELFLSEDGSYILLESQVRSMQENLMLLETGARVLLDNGYNVIKE